MNARIRTACSLYLRFFWISCFTFGGGWSIVAQMQKQFVERERLLSDQDLLDITCIGRSLPGTMIGNVAFLFGYHTGGWLCGLVCLLGMVTPPLLILILITLLYTALLSNSLFISAMTGIRAAIVPTIISAVINMRKGAYPYRICYFLTLICFALNLFFGVDAIVIVAASAVSGVLICFVKSRGNGRGAA